MNTTATRAAHEATRSNVPRPCLRVLLVEDDPADRDLILRELEKGEFEIISDVAGTADEFRQRIRTNCPDVVLADYNLGQWRGTEALEILRQEGLDIPLILVSGALGDVTAVECIKQGVTDYVLKDSLARLSVALRGALKDKNAREERKRAQESLAEKVEELARSNADLEQFAYVASHDLQEPLRMVAAYTQLLAERYRGKLDDQADKYIHYAVDGAVAHAEPDPGLAGFFPGGAAGDALKSTDCNEIVERAVENLRAAILESGAVVTHGPLPRLMASGSQLQQVFQHLIGNAMKFQRPPDPRHSDLSDESREPNGFSPWPTTASAFPPSTPRASSSFSTACTPAPNIPATALGWPSARRSSNGTAAGSRPCPAKAAAPFSISPCRRTNLPKDGTRHDDNHGRNSAGG